MTDWLSTLTTLVQPLVPVLGRALLNFLWQGTLVGLCAAALLQLLHAARPQLRYLVACLALLACLLLPLVNVLLHLATAAQPIRVPSTGATTDVPMPAALAPAGPLSLPFVGMPLDAIFPLVVALWAAGASLFSLRMALGVLWIQRLRAQPQGQAQATWQARLDVLARRFGLTRHVVLRLVDRLDTPVVVGWLRPVVLLPTALAMRMPVELLEALLAHELAHVRRHDYLVNLLQGVVEVLLFYHPATWWLSRRIRVEREHIADQLAAEATGNPRQLALALARLSELQPCEGGHSASYHYAPAARGGQLMSRIQQLLQPGERRGGGRIAFPLLGLAAACIALYAHAQVPTTTPRPGDATSPVAAMPAAPSAATTVPVPAASVRASATPLPTPVARTGSVLPTPTPTPAPGPTLPQPPQPPPAPPVPPAAPPAAPAPPAQVVEDGGQPVALIRRDGHGFTSVSSAADRQTLEAVRAGLGHDLVWFRRDGRAYVIDDPATVARASAAWQDVHGTGERMKDLSKQMSVHGDRMRELGAQMKKLTALQLETPEMRTAIRDMNELAEQQKALAMEQVQLAARQVHASDAERTKQEARLKALSASMDKFGEQMDRQGPILEAAGERLEANSAPLEALGKQMEAAAKPMDALGQRMDALGKVQERQIAQARRELQALIETALRQGLAKPSSSTSDR